MTTSPDALNPPTPPNRVYYSLGRMLGVSDFQSDQDYHRGRLARALLQLCGTGTISGLKVRIPQYWEASSSYAPWTFIVDANGNVQVNTGAAGTSGTTVPTWNKAAGATTADGNLTWTNEGALNLATPAVWRANTPYAYPSAIVDPNGSVQVLNVTAGITSGPTLPLWNTTIGFKTSDGSNVGAWTCVGPAALEVQVTPGVAVDRVGRLIEVPRAVCVPIGPWVAAQAPGDLANALHAGNYLIDVFASFVGCTRGVTPCFATQDDYDATDAFSPNSLLDSFAMQLILRTDPTPLTPQDPWTGIAAAEAPHLLQATILEATSGPGASFGGGAAAIEYPPFNGFDTTSVFLARLSIAPVTVSGQSKPDLSKVVIDNFSRLFLYSTSLVARWSNLSAAGQP